MKFVKLHSLGNDFLIIDPTESPGLPEMASLARYLCDRHTGVGADGLLLVSVEDRARGRASFRIFNADGSEPEISGNGLRCATAYLFFKKKVDPPCLIFETSAGIRECQLLEVKDGLFDIKIEMGVPRFRSLDIPFDDGSPHQEIIDYPLSINQKIYLITAVSIGNPHCAIFVDRFPSRIEWHQIGREIESHPFFPNRTNIEFVRILNRREIEVLFWERGVGETLSSGSGATAAAVASILKNLTDREVVVRTSMGKLVVEWRGEKVHQSGPAAVIFEGSLLTRIPG